MVFGLNTPQIPTISNMNFSSFNTDFLNDTTSTFSNLLSLQQMTSSSNMKYYLLGGVGIVIYFMVK